MKNTITKGLFAAAFMLAVFFGAAQSADAYVGINLGFGWGDPYYGYSYPGFYNNNNYYNNSNFYSPYNTAASSFYQPYNCLNAGYPCNSYYQPRCVTYCNPGWGSMSSYYGSSSSYYGNTGYFNDPYPFQTWGSNMNFQGYGSYNPYGYYSGV